MNKRYRLRAVWMYLPRGKCERIQDPVEQLVVYVILQYRHTRTHDVYCVRQIG